MNDTIVAISTARGVGAISIIRVSGELAVQNVNHIFKEIDLSKVSTHTIHYGHIISKNKVIDEVMVSVMLAPKTFTREDIVEINAHGGIATTNRILELLLKTCRLAEPGEFTKRAFLNGRIDLLEAEGVMDLIESKTEKSRAMALEQVSGSVSNMIHDLRNQLLEILANIEVNIDYPEYEDIEEYTVKKLSKQLFDIEQKVVKTLEESKNGLLMKEGIRVSLLGRPNVGKSSILNCLLGINKAIVTDIEGTTRDIVEGTIQLNGILIHLFDTAGIRSTTDIVEKIGVENSMNQINHSDLVLLVLNNNEYFTEEDDALLKKVQNQNCILVINKTDLPTNLKLPHLSIPIVQINTINKIGIENLKDMICSFFHLEKIETNDPTYLTSARSISILKKVLESIQAVKTGIQNDMPIDMIEIDVKTIWNLLGSITGETYEDELINQLFSQFCLGK